MPFEVTTQRQIEFVATGSAQDAHAGNMRRAPSAGTWRKPHKQNKVACGAGTQASPALPHGNDVEFPAHEESPGSEDGSDCQNRGCAQNKEEHELCEAAVTGPFGKGRSLHL